MEKKCPRCGYPLELKGKFWWHKNSIKAPKCPITSIVNPPAPPVAK